MRVSHDSQDLRFRKPFGAIAIEEKVVLKLKVTRDVKAVTLRLWIDNATKLVPMKKVSDFFVANLTFDEPQLVWYFFIIESEEEKFFYGKDKTLTHMEPESFQITVHSKEQKTPNWLKKGIVYQIMPDRFYKSGEMKKKNDFYIYHDDWNEPVSDDINHIDFYGGNLQGISEKLDYLKALGVSVLYLNPIFEARSNHKYDTGDHMKIDEMFGTEADFEELCKQAKKRDMRVILDGVFNHVGDDSKYFNRFNNYQEQGAYQSPESKYFDWFNFEEYPEKYECWWSVPSMPQINEMNKEYRKYINGKNGVIQKWLKAGASGWRLDVVDELPDEFVKELRKSVKEVDPQNVVIGEVWEDASNKVSYGIQREYFFGEELDGVVNYPFRNAILSFLNWKIDSNELAEEINSIRENYPLENLSTCFNLIGGHDVCRAKTFLNDNKDLFKLAVVWQMTFIGVPVIYYGDEVGLGGGNDPFNRASFPWNNVDLELLEFYKELTELRNSTPALQTGHFKEVKSDENTYSYKRSIKDGKDAFGHKAEDDEYLIEINRLTKEAKIFRLYNKKKTRIL